MLHVFTNDRTESALNLFCGAVYEYGVPSRVGVDGVSEFRHINNLMINFLNDDDRASHIVEESVNNVRIEPLWRDTYIRCLDCYYKLVCHMEQRNILDLQNPIHMFSLRYVFAAIISATIYLFIVPYHDCTI